MKKLYKIFTVFEKIVLSVPFIFLSVAIVTDVIARKLFGFSFSWLEELSRYIFIFATFMGAAVAITMDLHPKMTALQNAVGEKATRIMIIITDIIGLIIFSFVGRYALQQVQNLLRIGTRASSTNMPMWIFYVIIPISMASIIIRFVIKIIVAIKKLIGGGKV